jgi:hypothetical protein
MAEQQGQVGAVAPTPETGAGQPQAQTPQGQVQQEPLNADAFLQATGFKNLDDAAKTLKEQHAMITKTTQKLSQLEKTLQGSYAQRTQATPYQAPPPEPKQEDFFDDPQGFVARQARRIVQEEVTAATRQLEAKQIIDRVRSENPQRFEALRPIAQQIFVEKPYLNDLGEAGLREAMEEAEQRRSQYLAELKAELFATDNNGGQSPDKEQVRQELIAEQQRNRAAMIPETGANRPITDDIKKKMDEAKSKGDVDALIDLKFSNIKF